LEENGHMVKMLHMALLVVLIALVALAAALLQPEWARDLRLEKWTFTVWERELFGDPQWSQPNREDLERSAAKDRVVTALIEGRLTLVEAAAHFRRWKHPRIDIRREYRGDSEEEHLCRQVIRGTEIALRVRGEDAVAAAFAARWNEELRRHLEQHGKVILPEVDGGREAAQATEALILFSGR
jgi:hypothetical protein